MRVLIPFKGQTKGEAGEHLAKARLSHCLNEQQREDLAFAMFHNLLIALYEFAQQAPNVIESVQVVSKDTQCLKALPVRVKPEHLALSVYKEPASVKGLNAALNAALEKAEADEVKQVLILHADLPLVSAADIATLMNDAALAKSNKKRSDIHIIQDNTKTGTNGLVLPIPAPIRLSFGENSCQAHFKQALLSGSSCHIFQQENFSFDLDGEDDLRALMAYDLPLKHVVAACLQSLQNTL